MKVGGIRPGETTGPRKAGKSGAAEKGAFDRALRGVIDDDGGETAAARIDSAGPVTGLEALLALQSAGAEGEDDPAAGERRRQARIGAEMLDRLDRLRLGLIEGRIPEAELESLAATLRRPRDPGLDPGLSALLDDIALRAEVELAKLGRA